MKVGFDISQIAHGGGVGRYTRELAQELVKIPGLEMVFLYSSFRKRYSGNLKPVKNWLFPPTLLELMMNRFRKVKIEQLIGQIDVYHSSDWIQPPTSAKKVTTYHDVIPIKFPQWSTPKIIEVHKRRLTLVEKEIDKVIAVSATTKKDLIEVSNIPEQKIEVIYEGVGNQFKRLPEGEVERFRQKMELPEEFVLAIGGIGKRRNLEKVKEAAKDYHLVITGETIPFVSDNDMPLLYNAAATLFYPSLYEGFGLPVLEAMACGVPVLASKIPAIEEIVGDVALLVNPDDIDSMRSQLKELMGDNQVRKELIGKGLTKASRFTWEDAASRTGHLYEGLIK